MTSPVWMNAVIADFGRAAGLGGLALNDRGSAALAFENGCTLRLEYAFEELVVAMTLPAGDLKRLLSISHPRARYGFKVRTGLLAKLGKAMIAIRLKERDVTLPNVDAAFHVLWRLASELGGAEWA